MKNILFIISILVSTTSMAMAMPEAFTELFHSGIWLGEATHYSRSGQISSQFTYGAQIDSKGRSFNTIANPNNPEALDTYQNYTMTKDGLHYDLQFSASRQNRVGILDSFEQLDSNTWSFSKGAFTHRFIKISDKEMQIITFFSQKKHAEVKLFLIQ